MRLLLDTHIAIWALVQSARLPTTIRTMIEDRGNDVAVSVVTLWEVAIKNNLGRRIADPFPLKVDEAAMGFAATGFTLLPVDVRHLREVERLQRRHGDPFDRLLVATALADTYRLVTHDTTLAGYGAHVMLV